MFRPQWPCCGPPAPPACLADPRVVLHTGRRNPDASASRVAAVLCALAALAPAPRVHDAGGAHRSAGAARPLVIEGVPAVLRRRRPSVALAVLLRRLSPHIPSVRGRAGSAGSHGWSRR